MYQHTQRSPLHLLLYLPAIFMFIAAWQIRATTPPSMTLIVVGLLLFLLSLSFQTLTVTAQQDHLDVRYGPLNLFGTRIVYRDITDIQQGKTSLIDGWGIHFIPFRGWTLNLWGFDCARIARGDKVIRIGTDDAENLVRVIREKMASESEQQD